jgi:hypothetical protein
MMKSCSEEEMRRKLALAEWENRKDDLNMKGAGPKGNGLGAFCMPRMWRLGSGRTDDFALEGAIVDANDNSGKMSISRRIDRAVKDI